MIDWEQRVKWQRKHGPVTLTPELRFARNWLLSSQIAGEEGPCTYILLYAEASARGPQILFMGRKTLSH